MLRQSNGSLVGCTSGMTIHSEESAGGVKHRAALDATAGAIAGCVARLVVQPLDVLKIRFQVHMHCLISG